MATEQDKTRSALKTAIQMEIDGKEYYLKASRESGNEMGRELLKSLAKEEDLHRRKFETIYESMQSKQEWPAVDLATGRNNKLRSIFSKASEEKVSGAKAPSSELDAVQTAIAMEIKTHDFYKSQSKIAKYRTEKEFYEKVAEEEQQHHLVLLDYYEYIKNPAEWFASKEHHSLDGG